MTPSLLLLVPAVASAVGLPMLDAPQPTDFATAIQQFASQFATGTTAVLTSVNTAVLDISRVAYITCLLVGVLLYYTHLGRRLGKDLIVGGVLLVVITEYVIPTVTAFAK
jgi:small-conductance mechanosensitive channel